SMPMARSAVLAGRTLADLVRNVLIIGLMTVVGYIIGFRFGGGVVDALAAVAVVSAFGLALSWIFAFVALTVRGAEAAQSAVFVGHRPLPGYPVFAFTIPLVVLHLPFVMGVHWTLAGELRTIATYFALAVIWDYLWFVLNPAYTVRRFGRGRVWWFEVPWIWRFPLDYYAGIALSLALGGLAALAAGD